jgi:hypothetical protein
VSAATRNPTVVQLRPVEYQDPPRTALTSFPASAPLVAVIRDDVHSKAFPAMSWAPYPLTPPVEVTARISETGSLSP